MIKILVVVLVLSLVGCSQKKPVEISVKQKIEIDCGAAPEADRIKLLRVQPWVIRDSAGISWIGMTPKDYENLAINWQQVKKVLSQRKDIQVFYIKCIDSFNARP